MLESTWLLLHFGPVKGCLVYIFVVFDYDPAVAKLHEFVEGVYWVARRQGYVSLFREIQNHLMD